MIDVDERPATPPAGGDGSAPAGGDAGGRDVGCTPGERLAAARELAEAVCDGQLWRLGDDEVLDSVSAAYRLVATAQAAAVAVLGEALDRGLPTRYGAASPTGWLAAAERMRPGQARRDVALAAALRPGRLHEQGGGAPGGADAPAGTAAWAGLRAGVLSVEHAAAVTEALAELAPESTAAVRAAAEEVLVGAAAEHDPTTLARLGHRVLERVDPDAADRHLAEVLAREERQAARARTASRFCDGHGSVWYRLRVPTADDAAIAPVLDALSAPAPAGPDGPDPRTGGQRLADAFVEAFRSVRLGAEGPGGDRPRLTVAVDLEHLVSGLGCGELLETGDQLGIGAVRRLACDAQVVPVVLGGRSQPLDLGRARRTFTGPVRLALDLRDRGCVHPGCDRPVRWCDGHHIVPWWAGGATDAANGALLCGRHHRLYHSVGWELRMGADGAPESIPPAGVDPQRRPRRHQRFATWRPRPG